MLFMSVILSIFTFVHGFEIIEMNPENQQMKKIITITELNNTLSKHCFTYGLWTKYNPLGNIKQIGLYGLLNDYCFHLHNSIEIDSQSLNFIYRLDKQQQTIKKNNISLIQLQALMNMKIYGILSKLSELERFELIISQQKTLKFHKILQMKSPYSDKNLILIFGSNSKIQNIKSGLIFTYFPGYIRQQDYIEQSLSPIIDYISHLLTIYESFKICICNQNKDFVINDQDFQYLKQNQYISQNLYCDSFIFMGWIKIRNIVQVQKEFNYQFIKISANSKNTIIEDQNLSSFQFFLLYFRRRELQIINNITLWHYSKVELKFNQIIIDLKFYEKQNLYHFTRQYDVIQFKNYKIKLQFGNYLQLSQNYINIEIKNFQFYNYQQQLNEYNCPYSCLTCDGPNSYKFLSCSESRIYLIQSMYMSLQYN